MGVETGGCPHTAIRENASMNLAAIEDMNRKFPHAELCFIESGGDNLAATFSPELADLTIYVIDVAEGEKIPRKGGPGIIQKVRQGLTAVGPKRLGILPHLLAMDLVAHLAELSLFGALAIGGDEEGMGDMLPVSDGALHPVMASAEVANGGERFFGVIGDLLQRAFGSQLQISAEQGVGIGGFVGQRLPNPRGRDVQSGNFLVR